MISPLEKAVRDTGLFCEEQAYDDVTLKLGTASAVLRAMGCALEDLRSAPALSQEETSTLIYVVQTLVESAYKSALTIPYSTKQDEAG